MEIVGKMVKVRFKRYFKEQKLWVFFGRILSVEHNCFVVEGKGVVSFYDPIPAKHKALVDEEPRVLLIPRDNVAHVRILPDGFDINRIEFMSRGVRDFVKVEGGPDTSIGESV